MTRSLRSVPLCSLLLAIALPLTLTTPSAHARGRRAGSAPPIVATGVDEYEISRAELEAALAQGGRGTRARIVPEIRNGKAIGFRLFSVDEKGPFGKAGLRNGDILTAVNGHPVATPEQALTAYGAVARARRIVVSLERRGAPLELVYNVR